MRCLFTELLPPICGTSVQLFMLYKHVFKLVNAVFGKITFDWNGALHRKTSFGSSLHPTPGSAGMARICGGEWLPWSCSWYLRYFALVR